jgi:hypothetical protein
MRARTIRTTTAAALAVILVACGGDAAPTTTNTTTTEPAPTENVVEVRLVDFAFEGLPGIVPAGTRLTVVNASDSELHELVAFRLADGDQRTAAELATLTPHELEAALGMPTAVLIAAPGGPQIAPVGDGVLTAPGRYALFCFIPTGIDPDEYLAAAATSEGPPQFEDAGPPHFVHGMLADLTVDG